ncbi:hypothetical protein [Microvirga mediterraneensis]|uniref:Uncharacterized protein n=1 Tax=Microvirga mediterraneensis TaxID=2754695 RepID=A0A838BPX1_9HYPH|nr:hypothetical protein [Microvirga mediterraneensis]MBA1157478.1 hypothetical protein [Microvirga mediterraneensis]
MTTYSYDVTFNEHDLIVVLASFDNYEQVLREKLLTAPKTAHFRLEADLKRIQSLRDKVLGRPQLMSRLSFSRPDDSDGS